MKTQILKPKRAIIVSICLWDCWVLALPILIRQQQGTDLNKNHALTTKDAALLPGFEQIILKGTTATKGLFNCYKVNDKYYFEISDSLLEREMLIVTRMVKAPHRLTQLMHQYGGEQLNQQVWKWSSRGDQIFIKVPGYAAQGGVNGQMQLAVANSNLETILAAFTIKANSENGKGVLIEAGSFFSGDAPSIGISARMRKTYKVSDK